VTAPGNDRQAVPAGPSVGATGAAPAAPRGRHLAGRDYAIVGAILLPLAAIGVSGQVGSVGARLPLAGWDLAQSFGRMLLAYLLSLGFSLVYGYYASTHRTGERILIPVLDILQSVPILGFFPVVIVAFVDATPHSWVGPNFAAIFLIFTSMAWNMVFGVYESLKSIPAELREASDSFGVTGRQRIRKVLLPATVNRLVYNSVLSWTAGWYFLVAAEIISPSVHGIGGFLLQAATVNDVSALLAGILLLVILIAALDIFVWRPLYRWAEKYRYDQVPSGEQEVVTGGSRRAPLRRAAGVVYRGFVTGVTRIGTPVVGLAISATPMRLRHGSPRRSRAMRTVVLGTILVLVWLLLIALIVALFGVFSSPIQPSVRSQMLLLPAALGASFVRLIFAYLLSLGIALGLAVYIVQHPRTARLVLPVVEIVASVPATALFPLFVFALVAFIGPTHGGFEAASILMLMTGMLWYLFFNLLSGLRGVPPDLKEAAQSLGLKRWQYYRRLVLPAIFPAFVTGSITAFGGGWNALILAEYLRYGPRTFSVLGIGQLIDLGNNEPNGAPLMAAALLTMVFTVIAVNEVIWKPMYRRAVDRYRID
jgi:NitT/TauT family transport system permease protein